MSLMNAFSVLKIDKIYFLCAFIDKDVDEAMNIMQQRCRAAFFHYIRTNDNDEDEQHKYCPKTADSWCLYQNSKFLSNGKDAGVRRKKNRNYLDPVFLDILKPIIDRLTSRQLLRRCLRGVTQNSNESLNSVLW